MALLVAQITSTSAEQTQGIQEVNQAVSQFDNMSQQNAALAGQPAAADLELDTQARWLLCAVGAFRLRVPGAARKT